MPKRFVHDIDIMPERLAQDLHSKLPHSTYIPSKKHRPHEEIYDTGRDENAFGGFLDFVDEYEKFMS